MENTYAYKTKQLKQMLEHETSKSEEHYGANLKHWYGDTNPLTIDAGGLQALIDHYQKLDSYQEECDGEI